MCGEQYVLQQNCGYQSYLSKTKIKEMTTGRGGKKKTTKFSNNFGYVFICCVKQFKLNSFVV